MFMNTQRTGKGVGYEVPANVSTVAGFLHLMPDRRIFANLLPDKDICDMTRTRFSGDDI